MNYKTAVKQERSIPAQGRIDLVDLANLDKYFMSQGTEIKSISQLLNWGIGLVVEVLENNNVLGDKFDNLIDASRHLEGRGLYQPGMRSRGRQKFAQALTFESLRNEGEHPEDHVDKRQYNMLHNEGSVNVYDSGRPVISTDDVATARRQIELARQKKAAGESKSDTSKIVLREDMTDEELAKYNRAREEDIIAKENAPFDPAEQMRLQEERKSKSQDR